MKLRSLLFHVAVSLLIAAAGNAFAGPEADTTAPAAPPSKARSKVKIVTLNSDGEKAPEVRVWTGDGDGQWVGRTVKRGFLGVGLLNLNQELREFFGAQQAAGVLISKIEAGSPADKAGLEVGDVIVAVDGKPVDSSVDVGRFVGEKEDGQSVSLDVYRDKRVRTISADVVQREKPEIDLAPLMRGSLEGHLADLSQLDEERAMVFSLDPSDLEKFSKGLGETLESPEFKDRLRVWQSTNDEVEARMKELEKKLRDLEQRLKEAEAKKGTR